MTLSKLKIVASTLAQISKLKIEIHKRGNLKIEIHFDEILSEFYDPKKQEHSIFVEEIRYKKSQSTGSFKGKTRMQYYKTGNNVK